MIEGLRRPPLQVNETAPDFTLPLVNGDGTVSLSDYRGKRAVLLAIFRGLNCAFCRRHIVQLGSFQPKLLDAGVEVLAITGSPLQRARLYLRYRPIKVPLAAGEPDTVLDLTAAFQRCYDQADFGSRIDYRDVPAVLHDRIAMAAYEIWQEEGRPPGRDQEHWYKAVERVMGPVKRE